MQKRSAKKALLFIRFFRAASPVSFHSAPSRSLFSPFHRLSLAALFLRRSAGFPSPRSCRFPNKENSLFPLLPSLSPIHHHLSPAPISFHSFVRFVFRLSPFRCSPYPQGKLQKKVKKPPQEKEKPRAITTGTHRKRKRIKCDNKKTQKNQKRENVSQKNQERNQRRNQKNILKNC